MPLVGRAFLLFPTPRSKPESGRVERGPVLITAIRKYVYTLAARVFAVEDWKVLRLAPSTSKLCPVWRPAGCGEHNRSQNSSPHAWHLVPVPHVSLHRCILACPIWSSAKTLNYFLSLPFCTRACHFALWNCLTLSKSLVLVESSRTVEPSRTVELSYLFRSAKT